MIGFILSVPQRLSLSVVFLVLSLIFDWLDGPLARHQKNASDRGKFFDMFCDITSFTFFAVGLVAAEVLMGTLGIFLVYALIISKILWIIRRSRSYTSDWLFRPVAGFIPNFGVGVSYVAFIWFVVSGNNIIEPAIFAVTVLLLLDVLVSLRKIMNMV